MNRVKLRASLCAMCLVCFYSGGVAAQRDVECDANLKSAGLINARAVASLSVLELSRLGEAITLQNNFGGLTLRPFDDDDRPRHGKEIEIGFILARSGDLGGRPVGLIIWSTRGLAFGFKKSSESTITVGLEGMKNCPVLATFSLSESGTVLKDGKVVARAR